MLHIASLFLLLAVPARAGGVIAGHPVDVVLAPCEGITWTNVALPVATITVDFCGLGTTTYDVGATLDLGDPLLLPEGEICGVDLNLSSSQTVILGTGNSGGTVEIDLNLSVVQMPIDPSVTVTATSGPAELVLGAEDFVTATGLELGPNLERVVGPTSDGYAAIRAAIRNASSID